MATISNSTTSDVLTELRELQRQVELIHQECKRWEADYHAGGDPLNRFGYASKAHGIDLALRKIDAAIIRYEIAEGGAQ